MPHLFPRPGLVAAVLTALVAATTGACTLVEDQPTVAAIPGQAGPAVESTAFPVPFRGSVLLFGDSVARMVSEDLEEALGPDVELDVDVADCRRLDRGFTGPCGSVPPGAVIDSGVDGLRDAMEERVTPPDVVVVVIGNNAALSRDDMDSAMAALAAVPRVWWVTTNVEGRGWRDPNNALMAAVADDEPSARTIDWFAASEDRDLLVDHVHPNAEGSRVLADLIASHVGCDCVP